MKKRTFTAFAVAAGMLLLSISCQKNSNKETISLQSPTGQQVASSIQSLKESALPSLVSKHGAIDEFEITGIHYLPVAKGYAAIVSYRLQDGTTNSYGIFSGVTISLMQANQLTQMREADGKVTISCKGTCTCRLSATLNADTGVITVDCGCTGCSSTVTSS